MTSESSFTSDTVIRLSSSRQWPGERDPDNTDVDDANQNPASVFLERFRAALLHSASEELDEPLDYNARALENQMIGATGLEQYTYPMVLLSKVPSVPTENDLARLQTVFTNTFKHHILIRDLDLTGFAQNSMPPYLQFACAALAAIFSPSVESPMPLAEESASLFITGVHVWIVSLEVDNREARLIEAVYAAILLATYGILSAEKDSWRKGIGLLCNIVTIVRRLHLTDGYSPIYTSGIQMEGDISMKSSLLIYMLLVDSLQTIHCNSVPCFSMSELYVRMPSSNYSFRQIYDFLTHGYAALPSDLTSREDSLLLLIALLSDITYAQKSHLPLIRVQRNETPTSGLFNAGNSPGLPNPFAPLTSQSEYSRVSAMYHHALTRWERHFHQQAGGDIMALYHFVRIQLLCPDLKDLPLQVNYARTTSGPPSSPPTRTKEIEIPDKAVEIAWQILDDLEDENSAVGLGERRLSIWLPIVVFMSALVVWKKLRWQKAHQPQGGTMKVLSMFCQELAQYPWPCCGEMISVLERLIRS